MKKKMNSVILIFILFLEFYALIKESEGVILETLLLYAFTIFFIYNIIVSLKQKEKINKINFILVFLLILPRYIITNINVIQFFRIIMIYTIILNFYLPIYLKKTIEMEKLQNFLIFLIICINSFGMLIFHYVEGQSLFNSLYWSITTFSSVGYGDYVPYTVLGKISAMIMMIGGLIVVSLFTTFFIEKFRNKISKEK